MFLFLLFLFRFIAISSLALDWTFTQWEIGAIGGGQHERLMDGRCFEVVVVAGCGIGLNGWGQLQSVN